MTLILLTSYIRREAKLYLCGTVWPFVKTGFIPRLKD